MRKAYLTIDDGPSEKFENLVDFLHERKIPAVFFNRGDYMEARPEAVIYGIKKNFIMANHTYSHRRVSALSFEETCEEILRTDTVLESLYEKSGVKRPGKYFRFPYMDRGMGACLAEPDHLPEEYQEAQNDLLGAGLGHVPEKPGLCQVDKKKKIQKFLATLGYTNLPVQGVTIPWYAQTEMGQGIDSLCTYSTSDWALLERHRGRHGFNDLQDLKDKIDRDKWLKDESSAHIILAHDQGEIHEATTGLVDHMLTGGFKFSGF